VLVAVGGIVAVLVAVGGVFVNVGVVGTGVTEPKTSHGKMPLTFPWLFIAVPLCNEEKPIHIFPARVTIFPPSIQIPGEPLSVVLHR